jgi:hypothetical protein
MTDPISLTAATWIADNQGWGSPLATEGDGTLGCFAKAKDGAPVLLSCSHVVFDGYRAPASLSIYAGTYSSCCCGGPRIGVPVFDAAKPVRMVTFSTKDDLAADGFKDGKWYGGFLVARGQNGAGPTGGTSAMSDVFLTDCAIVKLDKNVKFQNVFRVDPKDPAKDIPLVGVPQESDDTWNGGTGIAPVITYGTRPDDALYVRVLLPRDGGIVLHGTMLQFKSKDSLKDPDLTGMLRPTDGDKQLYPFPIGENGGGARALSRQFMILPRPPPSKKGATDAATLASYKASYDDPGRLTFKDGDSGAIVINSKGQIIAMISRMWACEKLLNESPSLRDVMEFAKVADTGGTLGIATPILTILDHLELTIPADPKGWSGTVPSDGVATDETLAFAAPFAGPELESLRAGVARVRDQLRASRRGRVLLGIIGRHRFEVHRLFETVRAIHVAWRSLAGPAFLHHCQESLRDPRHVVPASIDGVTREALVDSMARLFVRHASRDLARHIERYRAWVVTRLPEVSTVDEVPAVVARRESCDG